MWRDDLYSKEKEDRDIIADENMMRLKKLMAIIVVIVVIVLLFLDMINLFSYGNKNLNYHNINIYNWVVFTSSIFAVLGTYIFTSIENEKKISQQKRQHKEIIENERKIQDNMLIMNYYQANKIREASIWIRDIKKYEFKIGEMINDEIKNTPTIDEINSKDMDYLVLNFRKDIKNMYYLYEDVELLNLSFINEENREFVKKIIKKRKGEGEEEENKTMKSPRSVISTEDDKKLKNLKTIKTIKEYEDLVKKYENLVKEYRRKYKNEMLGLIKEVNKEKEKKEKKEREERKR